jgi:peptidoglycan-associated lipoprotein
MRPRGFVVALAMLLGVAVAGCSSNKDQGATLSTGDGTNEPIADSIDVAAGSQDDFKLNVGRRTFFREGSADLDDTARQTLDKQAAWLQQHAQWKVKLQGFADDPGTDAQQTALSQKRADAVRDYLASHGVAPERMLAKGYGRDRLVGDCAEIECKAQNRRVITNPQDNPEF